MRRLSLAICMLLASAIFAAAASDDSITVTWAPMESTTRFYDPLAPDPLMPATLPDEAGVTVSDFECVATLNGAIVDEVRKENSTVAVVRVESADIKLRLTVGEWISKSAGIKIVHHEDGHRMIAEHFYSDADVVASAIARQTIGRNVYGSGDTAKEAANDALNIAANHLVNDYMEEVRDRSDEVQQAYDDITQHGTNTVDEVDAIEQALRQVAARHAQTRPD
ncbi:MAG: hypothetical protein ABSG31_11765 [Tepidisphaeraceae bacterium]